MSGTTIIHTEDEIFGGICVCVEGWDGCVYEFHIIFCWHFILQIRKI